MIRRTYLLYRITVSVFRKKLPSMWMSCRFKTSKDKKTNNNAFKKVKRKMLKLLHHDQD